MDIMEATLCLLIGAFFVLMLFYLSMCFVCWVNDVITNKSWKYWFK